MKPSKRQEAVEIERVYRLREQVDRLLREVLEKTAEHVLEAHYAGQNLCPGCGRPLAPEESQVEDDPDGAALRAVASGTGTNYPTIAKDYDAPARQADRRSHTAYLLVNGQVEEVKWRPRDVFGEEVDPGGAQE